MYRQQEPEVNLDQILGRFSLSLAASEGEAVRHPL